MNTPAHNFRSARFAGLALAAAAIFLVLGEPAAAASELLPPVLTTVEQVRRLPMEEAAKAYPVRLRGVITYRAQGRTLLFLQDATGGIYVHPDGLPAAMKSLGPGAELDVEGVSAAGRFAPFVQATGGRLIGLATMPDPVWLSPDQLSDPRHHSQWVELSGTVRAVRIVPGAQEPEHEAILSLGARAGRFTAVVYGLEALNPALTNLAGASVRARGVYGSIFNQRRQLVGMRLFVSSARDILVEQPAGPDPFKSPPRPVASLMQFDPGPDTPARVPVKGVVTLVAEDGFFLEDASGGVKVQPAGLAPVAAGDILAAAGFPAWGDWNPVLEDAEVRTLGRGAQAQAPLITVAQALSGDFGFRRVRLDALVLEVPRHSQPATLVLQAGDTVFPARLVRGQDALASRVKEGSVVRLTGVCVNQSRAVADFGAPASRSAEALPPRGARPSALHMLLDGPAGVTLLRAPSWWTAPRLAGGLAVLAAVLLGVLLWVVLLRRQVTAKTAIIRRQLARETVHEERERIARELHDTLEQEMAGIAMHLDAAGASLPASPNPARQAIETARALLDRSRAESRQSIWELRSTALEQGGLAAAFEELVRASRGSAAAQIDLRVTGVPRRLPAKVETHLFRIGHEALANALKHSGAPRVEMAVDFSPEALSVSVRDEGRGFEPAKNGAAPTDRFGLLGMKERAGKIHARLELLSRPGGGTRVCVTLPGGAPAPRSS